MPYEANDTYLVYVEDRVVYKTKAKTPEDAICFFIDAEGCPHLAAVAETYNVVPTEIVAIKEERTDA